MYHACTLRGPPAGLEKLTGHRLCPLCPGHTHTARSKRSSSASSVPSSLPRAESQRPSGFLEQVLPISGGVLWAQSSRERVNRGARAPWPHHDTLLPAEPAAVLCTCTSARRWSSDRAAHLESETVPRTCREAGLRWNFFSGHICELPTTDRSRAPSPSPHCSCTSSRQHLSTSSILKHDIASACGALGQQATEQQPRISTASLRSEAMQYCLARTRAVFAASAYAANNRAERDPSRASRRSLANSGVHGGKTRARGAAPQARLRKFSGQALTKDQLF